MLLLITYNILLFICCGYALVAGEKAGQYCALLFISASFLTGLPGDFADWQATVLGVFGIDLLCFLFLLLLAMRFNRGWLIWAAGLQLAGVTTHLSTIVAPDFSPVAYQMVTGFWSIPILLVMVAGIAYDQKSAVQHQRLR